MFYNCISLKEIDLTHFDTSGAESLYGMFQNCRNLASIDLSSFNTEKVMNFTNTIILRLKECTLTKIPAICSII